MAVTTAAREPIRKRAIAAGKKPTTAGINATYRKNQAVRAAAAKLVAAQKPAPAPPNPNAIVTDASTASGVDKARQAMESYAAAHGIDPSTVAFNPTLMQGPTQAALDAAARIDAKLVAANRAAMVAKRSPDRPGEASLAPGRTTPPAPRPPRSGPPLPPGRGEINPATGQPYQVFRGRGRRGNRRGFGMPMPPLGG